MKLISNTVFCCVISVLLICSQSALAQATGISSIADDFRIMRHESPAKMHFEKLDAAAQNSARANQLSATTRLTFQAYGQQFDMELEPNDELTANLPDAQKFRLKQSMQMYKGRIPGIQGSWARINRIGQRVSGAFWDGNELYLIDTSDEVGKAIDKGLTRRKSKNAYTLIYKMTDIDSSASCATEPNSKAFNNYKDLVVELKEQSQALPEIAALATRKLDVAIIADSQFTQLNSVNPQAAVIARMNVVDGIYSEQVGVKLNISEIRALTNNGVLSSTESSTLLDQLVNYTTAPGFNNPGITHLFTGRDLNGSTIGIAYIGVLCRKDVGVGLSQTNGTGTAGALTVAHEMGHNFGAPHDNQSGSVCASTAGTFIMNPFLNGSTQFSPCSLQQMSAQVSRAACITPISSTPTADVRPVIPVNPINVNASTAFSYRLEVRNDGAGIAQNVSATITVPTALTVSSVSASLGQCIRTGGTVNCNLGSLAANATGTITLNIQPGAAPANLVSNVQVSASNDSNTANNSTNVAINVNSTTVTTIFQTDFNANAGTFVYSDDVFRATRQPEYATGSRVVNAGDGKLQVILGGVNNTVVNNMSGGWSKSFTLSAARPVTLSFDYHITQAPNYEADEYSDALLAVDNRLIGVNGGSFLFRIAGDGEGGAARTSGLRHVDVDLGTLSAGSHIITLGGFNNKKTFSNESTAVLIDNVRVVRR